MPVYELQNIECRRVTFSICGSLIDIQYFIPYTI